MAERGLTMGRHRVRTLMRLNGMRPVWRCKIVHATDSKPRVAVSNNVLNRRWASLAQLGLRLGQHLHPHA